MEIKKCVVKRVQATQKRNESNMSIIIIIFHFKIINPYFVSDNCLTKYNSNNEICLPILQCDPGTHVTRIPVAYQAIHPLQNGVQEIAGIVSHARLVTHT